MSLEDVTKGMSENAGAKPAFGNSVKFVFAEGVIHVDGTGGGTNVVTNDDKDAQCTIKMSLDDFKAMASSTA